MKSDLNHFNVPIFKKITHTVELMRFKPLEKVKKQQRQSHINQFEDFLCFLKINYKLIKGLQNCPILL